MNGETTTDNISTCHEPYTFAEVREKDQSLATQVRLFSYLHRHLIVACKDVSWFSYEQF